MKKFYLLSAALMALAMTACNDEPIADKTPNAPGGTINGKYIAVNFRNTDSSRALADDEIKFEEGTADENAIAEGQLNFLFYDNDGNPFPMTASEINGAIMPDKDGQPSNWVKPVRIDGTTTDDNTNPTSGNSVLVLGSGNGIYEGKMPSRIVCVANVDNNTMLDYYVNRSIDDLLMNYSTAEGTSAPIHKTLKNETNHFIMTSATYWNGADIICWADIAPQNICANSDQARKNPVQIYIERIAAKASVKTFPKDPRVKTVTGDVMETTYWYYDEEANEVRQSAPKNIIMEPVGWNVNNVGAQNFGIKHLLFRDKDGSLYSQYFEDYRDFNRNGRSFWASTSSRNEWDQFIPSELNRPEGYVDYLFANTRDPFLKGEPERGLDNVRGRVNFAWTHASKILFAARPHLVDAGAEEFEPGTPGDQLMSFGGEFYTPEALCRVLERNNPGTRIAYGRVPRHDGDNGHFQVQFYELGEGSKDITQRDITNPLTGNLIAGVDAQVMQNGPKVQYWNGLAYYIINISNNLMCTKGPDKGKNMYGVVRNTSYNYDLTEYVGLGTPVPTPQAPTDVENPSDADTYVAAKLNILNWRLISNEHTLQ